MGKVYRTAQGREIDIEKLRLQHEMVPALGNMKVNARGDQLGPGGKILRTREQIMDEHYATNYEANQPVVRDGPIPTRSPRRADQPIPTSSRKAAQEFTPGDVSADGGVDPVVPQNEEPRGGLAKAIKRAQDGTEKKGIRRI